MAVLFPRSKAVLLFFLFTLLNCGGGGKNSTNPRSQDVEPYLNIPSANVTFENSEGDLPPQQQQVVATISHSNQDLFVSVELENTSFLQLAEVSLTGNLATLTLQPLGPAGLAVGQHLESVRLNVCRDVDCHSHINGSPQLISVTYTVSQTTNPVVNFIEINSMDVLRAFDNNPLGINLNYLMDDDTSRSGSAVKSLQQGLDEISGQFLRYPGGEKSDNYLWSKTPLSPTTPLNPSIVNSFDWPFGQFFENNAFNQDIVDFDEFIQLSQSLGATPVVVLPYDTANEIFGGDTGLSLSELKTAAVEWVRYANVIQNYNVRYWEFGNESWSRTNAATYAEHFVEWAQAMKAIDPNIRLGAQAYLNDPNWNETILTIASNEIDFLSVHAYPIWDWDLGYSQFENQSQTLNGDVRQTLSDIHQFATTPADRDRIRIAVTEINAIDWQNNTNFGDGSGWTNQNDLGHSLVGFDLIGQQLKNDRVDFVQFWNTRWINNDSLSSDINDALDKNNELLPMAYSVKLWGEFILDHLVETKSTENVISYASKNAENDELVFWLLNKTKLRQEVRLTLNGFELADSALRWVYSGESDLDLSSTYRQVESLVLTSPLTAFELDPLSITVLKIEIR